LIMGDEAYKTPPEMVADAQKIGQKLPQNPGQALELLREDIGKYGKDRTALEHFENLVLSQASAVPGLEFHNPRGEVVLKPGDHNPAHHKGLDFKIGKDGAATVGTYDFTTKQDTDDDPARSRRICLLQTPAPSLVPY
jgi:hypothetical protein